jgi:arabinoxylan arabinofuranohydrolase
MTKILFLIAVVIIFGSCNIRQTGTETTLNHSGNPIITHMYTADPSARVFNDTLWIFPSHDPANAEWFDMIDYHVFSTTDMINYTDHGRALHLDDIIWAEKYAWAPDAIERNGKYYFYFPTDQENIGVAVSNRPHGPFTDPLGKPLITRHSPGVINNRDFIDPAVFIDDDGQAYMFVGQIDLNAIKLNEDMISYTGEVYIIEGIDHFFEAIWIHKYNNRYYLSYAGKDGHGGDKIMYAISDNILGPYEYQGIIFNYVNSGTNHHSIVEYKGQWYFFYHNSNLYFQNTPEEEPVLNWDGINPFRRSICVDYLYYNPDGTIQKIIPTAEGVKAIETKNQIPIVKNQ